MAVLSVIRGWQDENDREACIESHYIKKSAFRRDLCGDSAYNGIVYDNREHFGKYGFRLLPDDADGFGNGIITVICAAPLSR